MDKKLGLASLVIGVVTLLLSSTMVFGLFTGMVPSYDPEASTTELIIGSFLFVLYLFTLILGYFGVKTFKEKRGFPYVNSIFLVVISSFFLLSKVLSYLFTPYVKLQFQMPFPYLFTLLFISLSMSVFLNGLILIIENRKGIKVIPILVLILLNVITGGIYSFIWFVRNKAIVDKKFSYLKFNSLYLYLFVVLSNLVISFPIEIAINLGYINTFLLYFSRLITYSYFLMIIISFQLKRKLEVYFSKKLKKELKFSKLATLIFVFYYLQYKINKVTSSPP